MVFAKLGESGTLRSKGSEDRVRLHLCSVQTHGNLGVSVLLYSVFFSPCKIDRGAPVHHRASSAKVGGERTCLALRLSFLPQLSRTA